MKHDTNFDKIKIPRWEIKEFALLVHAQLQRIRPDIPPFDKLFFKKNSQVNSSLRCSIITTLIKTFDDFYDEDIKKVCNINHNINRSFLLKRHSRKIKKILTIEMLSSF